MNEKILFGKQGRMWSLVWQIFLSQAEAHISAFVALAYSEGRLLADVAVSEAVQSVDR